MLDIWAEIVPAEISAISPSPDPNGALQQQDLHTYALWLRARDVRNNVRKEQIMDKLGFSHGRR